VSELAVLRGIQSFANPVLDTVFIAITMLGSEEFYILFIAALYWCVDRELGFRLGMLVMASFWLNCLLKDFFQAARPSPAQVRVLYPESAEGYSFPSAHTQGSLTFWGELAVWTRRRDVLLAAFVIVPLVALSRLYLGVHWPKDLAGGAFFGFLMLASWPWISSATASAGRSTPFWLQLSLCLVIPAVVLVLDPNSPHAKIAGFVAGFLPASMLERRYVRFGTAASMPSQLKKMLFGGALVMVFRFGLKLILPETAATTFVRYVLVAVAGGLLAPLLFLRVGLASRETA
jgi:membrane-associated phospholipid phosphatase